MRYSIHFQSGATLSISQSRYQNILENNSIELPRFFEGDWPYIDVSHIDFILPEEESASGISSMPTPDDLKDQKKKEVERIKNDPGQILKRVQEKYDDDK